VKLDNSVSEAVSRLSSEEDLPEMNEEIAHTFEEMMKRKSQQRRQTTKSEHFTTIAKSMSIRHKEHKKIKEVSGMLHTSMPHSLCLVPHGKQFFRT
jgi:hypothetical protein